MPIIRNRDWVLTQEAFDRLLAHLDADAERAAEQYEQTRAQLIRFFACRGCAWPGELADETINRVARKLSEGSAVPVAALSSYFLGVARNVMKEHLRHPEREAPALDSLPPGTHPAEDPARMSEQRADREQSERRLECMEHCLQSLPSEDRQLLFAYYLDEQSGHIAHRKRLAERLGLSLQFIRVRVHRLRGRLEKCVGDCLGSQPA